MQEMYRHFVDNHRCVTLHGLKGKIQEKAFLSIYTKLIQHPSILRILSIFFSIFPIFSILFLFAISHKHNVAYTENML
jgi:hypothetical protein